MLEQVNRFYPGDLIKTEVSYLFPDYDHNDSDGFFFMGKSIDFKGLATIICVTDCYYDKDIHVVLILTYQGELGYIWSDYLERANK